MRAPGLGAGQRGGGGAEQHRIDVVEVPVGGLEQLAERRAERVRGRRGQPLREVGDLVVARPRSTGGPCRRTAPRRWSARSRPGRPWPPERSGSSPTRGGPAPGSTPSSCSLCSAVSTTRALDLHRAAHRGGRRDQERDRGRLRPRSAPPPSRRSPPAGPGASPGTAPLARPARARPARRTDPRPAPARAPGRWPSRRSRRARASSRRTGRPGTRRRARRWRRRRPARSARRPTTGTGSIRPRPPMHAAAKPRPACSPPRAWAPQSTSRAPESSVRTSIPSASASATIASTSAAARSFIDRLIAALLLVVEDQDLAAAELGPVARPPRPGPAQQRVVDGQAELARPAQLQPQRRRPEAGGERIAGQRLHRPPGDEAAALVAEPGLRADAAQRDHRARQHPQPGAAPRPPADRHQAAPHAGAGLLAGVARHDDLAAGHARAGARDRRRPSRAPASPEIRSTPAGHLGARPGADIAAHLDLAAAHAARPGDRRTPLDQHPAAAMPAPIPSTRRRSPPAPAAHRRARHLEQVADGHRLARRSARVSAATSEALEPAQPLGDQRAPRAPAPAGCVRRVSVSVTAGRAAPRAGSGTRRACRRSWRR